MARNETRTGALYALAAYGAWGFLPIYWKTLARFPALELLAHRVIWSLIFLVALLAWKERLPRLGALLRSPRSLAPFVLSGGLIGVNWYVFIVAVNSGRVMEASLGYFMNPLLNVAIGAVALGERLRRLQWAAVGLAAVGVLQLALDSSAAGFPVISLTLATSFALYGLVRKRAPEEPLVGSAAESAVLVLPALIWLGPRMVDATATAAWEPRSTHVLLAVGGAVTALPLLWFAEAARRLRLSTLGLFQYLAPSLQFLLAVLAYGEAMSGARARAFALIWGALALYTWDARRAWRSAARAVGRTPQAPA